MEMSEVTEDEAQAAGRAVAEMALCGHRHAALLPVALGNKKPSGILYCHACGAYCLTNTVHADTRATLADVARSKGAWNVPGLVQRMKSLIQGLEEHPNRKCTGPHGWCGKPAVYVCTEGDVVATADWQGMQWFACAEHTGGHAKEPIGDFFARLRESEGGR